MSNAYIIEVLASLLRGELAATETYHQALASLADDPSAMNLRQIHVDHREAVDALRQRIQAFGGDPNLTSGGWGTFTRVVEGAAAMLSSSLALSALKEGEESGKAEYEAVVNDPHIPDDFRTLIASTLLPKTERHIATLNRLLV